MSNPVVKKVQMPIATTIVAAILFFGGAFVYEAIRAPLEAKIAVRQADGTDEGAIVGGFFARHDVPALMRWGGVLVIGASWGRYALRRRSAQVEGQSSAA